MKKVWLIVLLLLANYAYAQSQRPNIIFILADDLGIGDIGCYGQQKIATPNIDKLAKAGKRFTQFYAGSTVCAPSRSSLMTGLHTGHTAVRGNKTFKPEGQFPLPDSVETIANILQQSGYATGAFGKWSLGFINTSGDPQRKGFDEFYGYNCQTLAHNYYPDHLWKNHERIDFVTNKKSNDVYAADIIHRQALLFIEKQRNQPFFAYLPYTLPHADVIAPHDELYDYYVKKFGEPPVKPGKNADPDDHTFEPYPHAAFAAMVARLDKFVGEIVATVRKKGIEKNTLIIFTSDNGPHREHGGDPEYFNGNSIYKGIKRDLYEGGIRVPFIATWQGHIKPGTSNLQAAFWDIFPTFQTLAGIKVSTKVDGLSLVPTLVNKGVQQQHKYLYWEFLEGGGKQAIRYGKWKGVWLNVSTQVTSTMELFDLLTDPGEIKNVSSDNPEIVALLKSFVQQSHVSNSSWPFLYNELHNL